MKQELKFNAYIPDLGMMLEGVCIYSGGDIGLGYDEFNSALKKAHPEYTLDSEEGRIYREFKDEEGDEDTEDIMTVNIGEDWVFVDSSKVHVLQFTGFKNNRWIEICAGHVVQLLDLSVVTIEWLNGCFGWWVSNSEGKSFAPLCIQANAEMLIESEVLGYIFDDKFKINNR